tara:strand:+ start:274 stop:675 length:402 start_codon:yes stop_codon:yes gene_type:complete
MNPFQIFRLFKKYIKYKQSKKNNSANTKLHKGFYNNELENFQKSLPVQIGFVMLVILFFDTTYLFNSEDSNTSFIVAPMFDMLPEIPFIQNLVMIIILIFYIYSLVVPLFIIAAVYELFYYFYLKISELLFKQ